MNNRTLVIVVGTRPNFIKVTQFKLAAADFDDIDVNIVHTGQHYDEKMATVFFDQFGLRPDVFLNISPNHPGLQIADTITALTQLFLEKQPNMVMVVGDVNATLAAAIAANKCNLPVAHLESGLRSNDMEMPEEHNRIVADGLADLHFVTEDSGLENLRREGKNEKGIAFVGNTMIDTLVAFQKEIEASAILETLDLEAENFALVTLHRPSNVDTQEGLEMLLKVLEAVSRFLPAVFPMHPRTRNKLADFKMDNKVADIPNLKLVDPLGYFEFQKLIASSRFVLTDSGGIQEETTFLKKPCLTLRPNTERPITVTLGSNVLLPFDVKSIVPIIEAVMNGKYKSGQVPELWDGKATQRVLQRIERYFDKGH